VLEEEKSGDTPSVLGENAYDLNVVLEENKEETYETDEGKLTELNTVVEQLMEE
jgi:hypothetical protein